ncbi:MAG: hypothetical protein NTV24_02910 [Candidatus Woesebacteria bacterium]|nr:hypothetical protein [Candidatus Woesebacteria bacterium]
MLEYLQGFGERTKNNDFSVLAGIMKKLNGGKDVPFPTSEQTLSLEEATSEYKNSLNSPESLTRFMRSFWLGAGQRIGEEYIVSKFPLKSQEIKERTKNGQMAIFCPAEVSRVDLGRMFPKMGSWAVEESNSAVDTINNSGWLWIESSIDAPNRNTTEKQLGDTLKKAKRQGQSLRTYIIGGQISKLLTGRYFDEGPTWSRLLGSCDEGPVLCANFYSLGDLRVSSALSPGGRDGDLGGRSEEVIKA